MANPGPSASKRLLVWNRQRRRRVDPRLFRRILLTFLSDHLGVNSFELALTVVDAAEMTRLNETFLRHRGSTDVLAFDYAEVRSANALRGEIFICLDEALIQAARFHTSWQSELVRYAVHGILHLAGYDDKGPASRRRMKREETRHLKELSRRFRFEQVAKGSRAADRMRLERG